MKRTREMNQVYIYARKGSKIRDMIAINEKRNQPHPQQMLHKQCPHPSSFVIMHLYVYIFTCYRLFATCIGLMSKVPVLWCAYLCAWVFAGEWEDKRKHTIIHIVPRFPIGSCTQWPCRDKRRQPACECNKSPHHRLIRHSTPYTEK